MTSTIAPNSDSDHILGGIPGIEQDPLSRTIQTVNTGRWQPSEDELLRAAVAKLGTRWVAVAAEVGTRNGEQCAKRWKDNLNPSLDHSFWSVEEDRLLLSVVSLYGNNWKLIAESSLKGRAPLSIKNRYSLLMRRQKRQLNKQQQRSCVKSTESITPQRGGPSTGFDYQAGLNFAATTSTNTPSSVDTPLSTDSQPSSSNSNTSYSGNISGVSSQPSENGSVELEPASTLHFSDPFLPHDPPNRGTGAEFTLSATLAQAIRPPESDQSYDQDATQPLWEGRGICNGSFDFNSFFNNTDVPPAQEGLLRTTSEEQSQAKAKDNDNKGLEFSVTCSRAKLKAMVCLVFDGAMSETAGLSDDETVTVTMRLLK